MTVYAIHAAAPNDTNGNPVRAYLLYDEAGTYLGAVSEGYRGVKAIGASGLVPGDSTVFVLARIPTTRRFVRDCLKGD